MARAAYDDMTAGKLLTPPPNTFAPCCPTRGAIREDPQELGFDPCWPIWASHA